MAMTGDFAGLDGLAKNIALLSKIPSQAAKDAAEGIGDLIQKQFDDGRGPDGKPWAPLKGGGRSFLQETQAMRDGIVVRPSSGAGIEVTSDSDYLAYHQHGTRRMPARPVLPEGELPMAWVHEISVATENAVSRRLGGR